MRHLCKNYPKINFFLMKIFLRLRPRASVYFYLMKIESCVKHFVYYISDTNILSQRARPDQALLLNGTDQTEKNSARC